MLLKAVLYLCFMKYNAKVLNSRLVSSLDGKDYMSVPAGEINWPQAAKLKQLRKVYWPAAFSSTHNTDYSSEGKVVLAGLQR